MGCAPTPFYLLPPTTTIAFKPPATPRPPRTPFPMPCQPLTTPRPPTSSEPYCHCQLLIHCLHMLGLRRHSITPPTPRSIRHPYAPGDTRTYPIAISEHPRQSESFFFPVFFSFLSRIGIRRSRIRISGTPSLTLDPSSHLVATDTFRITPRPPKNPGLHCQCRPLSFSTAYAQSDTRTPHLGPRRPLPMLPPTSAAP